VVDEIGKLFAVTGAAPRVGVKDDVVLGGPDLGVEVEPIAKVREGTAVNLQDQGIFLGGIKTRRLDDPAFDFAFIEGRVVPEFFDGAEFLGGEEFAIERCEDVEFGIGERSDRDVARIGGRVVLDSEGIIPGDAEIAAALRCSARTLVEPSREIGELGVALIGVREENAFAVGGPARIGHIAIEFGGDRVGIAAIAVGDV
jgi:hypothetical protein